jgi:hypothetical protein
LHDQLIAIVKKLCDLFGLDEEDIEDRLGTDVFENAYITSENKNREFYSIMDKR